MDQPVHDRTRGRLGNQEKEPLRNPGLDILVHAHPADMMTAVPKRRNESTEAFHVRRDAHRAAVLARRVEFVWRA